MSETKKWVDAMDKLSMATKDVFSLARDRIEDRELEIKNLKKQLLQENQCRYEKDMAFDRIIDSSEAGDCDVVALAKRALILKPSDFPKKAKP